MLKKILWVCALIFSMFVATTARAAVFECSTPYHDGEITHSRNCTLFSPENLPSLEQAYQDYIKSRHLYPRHPDGLHLFKDELYVTKLPSMNRIGGKGTRALPKVKIKWNGRNEVMIEEEIDGLTEPDECHASNIIYLKRIPSKDIIRIKETDITSC